MRPMSFVSTGIFQYQLRLLVKILFRLKKECLVILYDLTLNGSEDIFYETLIQVLI